MTTVLEHYERFLGRLVEVAALARGTRVLRYGAEDEEYAILATDGMSQQIQRGRERDAERRTELLLECRRSDVEFVAPMLFDLARYPFENGTCLHWFHVLPLGKPIVPGSTLTAAYLAIPATLPSEFHSFDGLAGRIDILQAIPITEAERQLFIAKGSDELEDELERASADITDLQRKGVA